MFHRILFSLIRCFAGATAILMATPWTTHADVSWMSLNNWGMILLLDNDKVVYLINRRWAIDMTDLKLWKIKARGKEQVWMSFRRYETLALFSFDVMYP